MILLATSATTDRDRGWERQKRNAANDTARPHKTMARVGGGDDGDSFFLPDAARAKSALSFESNLNATIMYSVVASFDLNFRALLCYCETCSS